MHLKKREIKKNDLGNIEAFFSGKKHLLEFFEKQKWRNKLIGVDLEP
jgi:hypothetical protein